MNKTEILNIINEPSKHIQIVKIDGKDSIVYSSKFVELLELIPTMLTNDDVVAMLTELKSNIDELASSYDVPNIYVEIGMKEIENEIQDLIQQKINFLSGL